MTKHLWFVYAYAKKAKNRKINDGKDAGQSPGFSSRGANIFKIPYWMCATTGGPNVKWGGTDFKWGGTGNTAPPGDAPGKMATSRKSKNHNRQSKTRHIAVC